MILNDEKKSINIKTNKQILIETLVLMAITLLFPCTNGVIKSFAQFAPIVYFFVEKHIRNRNWNEVGFKFKNTLIDIKNNWHWIVLDVIGIQFLFVLAGTFLLPNYIVHVKERLPMIVSTSTISAMIITITIATFLEEVVYRSFFQERLSWFIKPTFAILITSIIFGLVHFSKGSLLIVSFDIFGVILDSLIYGIIYNNTKNIFASWCTHYLADVIGVILILILFK